MERTSLGRCIIDEKECRHHRCFTCIIAIDAKACQRMHVLYRSTSIWFNTRCWRDAEQGKERENEPRQKYRYDGVYKIGLNDKEKSRVITRKLRMATSVCSG